MPDVKIGSQGVLKTVARYSPEKAVAEYVWNGFDADATEIHIDFEENAIGGISDLIITDNGTGIDYTKLDNKFGPWMESEKQDMGSRTDNSEVHGKNGIGRMSFVSFALDATWLTTYKSADGHNYTYEVTSTKTNAQKYTVTSKPARTEVDTGTRLVISSITKLRADEVKGKVVNYLVKDFCWYLELNKGVKFIFINGKKLDYSDFLVGNSHEQFIHEQSGTVFDVDFYQWKEALNEYSKYYFIKSNNHERHKKNTSFNNKGDGFYHSVIIKSSIFDDFDFTTDDAKQQSFHFKTKTHSTRDEEYKYLMGKLNELLRKKRYPFLNENANRLIEELEENGAIPEYNANDSISTFVHTSLVDTLRGLYKLEPRLFQNLNKEQKLTFTRFISLALQSGSRTDLFKIIEDVINLTDTEREELSDLLKNVSLSKITNTVKLLKDRDETIADLSRLVHDPTLYALEVPHLQDVIQANCWIFGEEYNLVAAEDVAFDRALRAYRQKAGLSTEGLLPIDHEDKARQVDIFVTRKRLIGLQGEDSYFENIIIELKAPNVKLGKKELDQVERYMRLIKGDPQFNSGKSKWTFILVGNELSRARGEATEYVRDKIDANRQYGRDIAIFDAKNDYIVKVKTWSTIIDEFKIRHDFLYRKLELERDDLQEESLTAEQAVDRINTRETAELPTEDQIGAKKTATKTMISV